MTMMHTALVVALTAVIFKQIRPEMNKLPFKSDTD